MLNNIGIKNKLDNKLIKNNKVDYSMPIFLKKNEYNFRVFINNISYKIK